MTNGSAVWAKSTFAMTGTKEKRLPKISVITPAFSSKQTIEDSIQSVLSQGYPNLEFIIVDGGSTDGTMDIVRRYEEQLAHWFSESDNGQYDAINKGFSSSTGEILCWLNADDMLLRRSRWVASEVFSQLPEIEWFSTLKPGGWDANGSFTGTIRTPGFCKDAFLDGLYLPGTLRQGHWIQQESTFWRRSLWEKAGGRIPEKYFLAGDFALWAAFYKYSEMYGIDYPIVGFRFREGQRSEAIKQYIVEANIALQELRVHFDWKEAAIGKFRNGRIIQLPRLSSRLLNRYGYIGKRIVNRNIRKVGSGWKIESYRFLP